MVGMLLLGVPKPKTLRYYLKFQIGYIMAERHNILLRFDGAAVSGHSIDMSILAPSLLAFNEMLRTINATVNEEHARVKLNLKADIQANCVTLLLEFSMYVWKTAKLFTAKEEVIAAKEIIEWLGIGSVGPICIWNILQKRKQRCGVNKKGENVEITYKDGTCDIIANKLFKAAENEEVVRQAQRFSQCIRTEDDLDSITIVNSNTQQAYSIDTAQAQEIYDAGLPVGEDELAEEQEIIAHIVIHAPILDGKSKKWRFKYKEEIKYFDISATSIAVDIMQRGKVVVGDTYKVRLQITQKKTVRGYDEDYKILEVLEFIAGSEQQPLI